LLLLCIAVLGPGTPAGAAVRDDTDVLQAKLDAGGAIFLPKLPDGACYRTRGLWLSQDDTTVTSDGACIVSLGFGPARLDPDARRPHFANAVFYIDHSNIRAPVPARVSISGLRIDVPKATRMHGVFVNGHETTLSNLTVGGAPRTGILVGSGVIGAAGMSARIAITGSTVTGAQRDGITVYGPIGLQLDRNLVSRASGSGISIRSADRGQPVLDSHVVGNTLRDNGGPGVLLDLDPKNGVPLIASGIEMRGNQILHNAQKAPAGLRGGIVIAGKGDVSLSQNVLRGNRGKGVLLHHARVIKKQPLQRTVAPASGGDDTAWLQARLDRGGGTVFLPKLPGDRCYATRGLWVSHDETTITSDGACIVSLGLGPVRLHSIDGDPIAADAVFFVNRSDPKSPAPVDVTISNLRIVVAPGQPMYGVAVFGHAVTLSHLDIGGVPKDDVTISGRANGNSYAGDISVLDSTLSGAARNAVSATGSIGLHIERNTIQGVRDAPPGQPGAGIDVEPDTRDRPELDVRITGNTIQDNAGPGILLELEPNEGPAVIATALEISGNTIVRNSNKPSPPKRAGIVLAGGQDGGAGTLLLKDNVIRGNGGPPIFETHLKLIVDSSGNQIG
jgi:hypothetical protein